MRRWRYARMSCALALRNRQNITQFVGSLVKPVRECRIVWTIDMNLFRWRDGSFRLFFVQYATTTVNERDVTKNARGVYRSRYAYEPMSCALTLRSRRWIGVRRG